MTPAGTSNEFDVQNKTQTHTAHFVSLVHNNTKEAPLQTDAHNTLEGRQSWKVATMLVVVPTTTWVGKRHRVPPRILPRLGAAAAAGGGGVVDNNSSPVVEDGNGLTATTQTVHSENGTPVTVKIVKTATGNIRVKRSWIWQVMHQREKRDLLGLQTLDELCFNERNDWHDTALREEA